jgi:predicted DNA-binding WGR domain protein
MTTLPPTLRLVLPRLLIKSGPGSGAKIAHSGKHALYGNPPRWHLITTAKPAPKGAPVASHPTAAGQHMPAAHFTDAMLDALKLPDSNVNAPAYNKALGKLKEWSDTGNVTAIVGAGFGTNTYGQKLAKVANHILALYGSPHMVKAGQKAGEHKAVGDATAPAQAADPQGSGPYAGLALALKGALPANLDAKVDGFVAALDNGDDEQEAFDAARFGDKAIAAQKVLAEKFGMHLVAKAPKQFKPDPLPDLDSPEDMATSFKDGKPAGPAMSDSVKKMVDSIAQSDAAPEHKKVAIDAIVKHHAGQLTMPDFQEGKTVTGVKALYEKTAQKIIDHAHAGNLQVVQDAPEPHKKMWQGKTPNSKKLVALHAAALEHAMYPAGQVAAGPKDGGSKPSQAATPATGPQPVGNSITEAVELQKLIKYGPTAAIGEISNALFSNYENKFVIKDAGGLVTAAIAFGVNDAPGGKSVEVHHIGSVEKGAGTQLLAEAKKFASYGDLPIKLYATKDAVGFYEKQGFVHSGVPATSDGGSLMQWSASGPKEGDTKPAADGGTLVLKDGHWVKQGGGAPAAGSTGALLSQQLQNLQSIPWYKQKLPDANTNAKSHNAAVTKIEAMAFAGDKAGLQAFIDAKGAAKQTYAKKQVLLAQTALAGLGEPGATAAVATEPAPAKPVKPTGLVSVTWSEAIDKIDKAMDAGDVKTIDDQVTLSDGMYSEGAKAAHAYALAALAYLGHSPSEPSVAGGADTPAASDGVIMHNGHAYKKSPDAEHGWMFQVSDSGVWHEVLNEGVVAELDQAHGTGKKPPITAKPGVTADTPLTEAQKQSIDSLDFDSLQVLAGDDQPLPANVKAAIKKKLARYAGSAAAEADVSAMDQITGAINSVHMGDQMGEVTAVKAAALSWLAANPGTDKATEMAITLADFGHTMVAAELDLPVPDDDAGFDDPEPVAPAQKQFNAPKTTLHNTLPGHSKSWSVYMAPNASGGFDMVTEYGKIGGTQQQTVKPFPSAGSANIAMQKLVSEKKSKGYKLHAQDMAHTVMVPASGPVGPKEGDTKQGADGMLVLKNGHWVKVEAATATGPAAPPAMDGWTKTGGQGGSNPGGKFKDPTGQEWYVKWPNDPDAIASEVLAAKLYALAGLASQDCMVVTKDGKPAIATKWVNIKKAASPGMLADVVGVRSGFAVDAWLGNWDVVGMGLDNLQIGPDGKAHRVDAGGSLEYRAQGAKKPFGPKVDEIDTLRDAKLNPHAAAVFGQMKEADLVASVAKVLSIDDSAIRALVFDHGPGTEAQKKALADTLIARKADLLARFPKAAKPTKKALDPKALPVDAKSLPKVHDFSNWNGAGAGLSSKAYVNKANEEIESQMRALAAAGNMVALAAFQFPEVDKNTGLPTGKMIPVAQHPSKHVLQYQQDLLQVLDEVANPPQPLKIFRSTDVGSVASLNAAFPPKKFGTTVSSVQSNEKLGFWVALGAVGSPLKFKPKTLTNYSEAAIAAAKSKYAKASSLAKHFISSVQASGSYNDLFRDGKTHDKAGNSLKDVAKAALAHSTPMPAGTCLYRWQKMSPQMLQHIMSAKDGTVFQATGPMCTSYSSTATKGFGTHRVKIVYAEGARAVESFASGGFAGEKEVTTLPNARFVILSKNMVPDTEHGNPTGQRMELEILMLPPDLGI